MRFQLQPGCTTSPGLVFHLETSCLALSPPSHPFRMPAITLYGRRWHFSSDVVPLPALLGALYHGAWILILVLFAAIGHRWPHNCESWEGRQYTVLFATFFGSFIASFLVELLLVYHSSQGGQQGRAQQREGWVASRALCRAAAHQAAQALLLTPAGAPFEISKRKHVPTLLYLGTLPLVVQLAMAGAAPRPAALCMARPAHHAALCLRTSRCQSRSTPGPLQCTVLTCQLSWSQTAGQWACAAASLTLRRLWFS